MMKKQTFLIYGISKGLGKALSKYLPKKDDLVYGVSRTEPDYLNETTHDIEWIATDLSNPSASSDVVCSRIGDQTIDCLIYNVGIWEHNAFSETYDFLNNSSEEIINIINTNISSCLLAIQNCIENLKKSTNAKIILIGSTWGLDNHNGKEIAFSATKFALRGIVHSLRENMREYGIGVSIVNLGYLATDFDYEDGIEKIIQKSNGELIPLQDVVEAVRFIVSTSNASCVKEINMPAMKDINL